MCWYMYFNTWYGQIYSQLLMFPQGNCVKDMGKWGQRGTLLYFYLFTPELFQLLQRISITSKKIFLMLKMYLLCTN